MAKTFVIRRKKKDRGFHPGSEELEKYMQVYKEGGGTIQKLESPDRYYEAGCSFSASDILSQFEH